MAGRTLDTALIVGYLASACSVASFVPQVWKVMRTDDTEAISTRMYALTVVGFALWSAFGMMRGEWPIILTNSICFCLSGVIFIKKLRS
ncbi:MULTISPECIES: SemiSWEET family sugar transporter [Phyllobacterium]|jgi:MtN3 and saliva related transmembrane protein|uniref:SemiSWEET family sugar transporter n=1 Tax=Phyllobacterium TaxID=28100 RepID=UPI001CD01F37|nr:MULTISPECIES: SemiSWEET transporter [unclassified Phyllobacterium]MBZ9605465.1 SemiSWEET transporter [Phyllobacterium sp. KW56]